MVALKEFITQELETLNEEQLRQVADFMAFLKFCLRSPRWKIDESQLATLYGEFAEEDQKLAEEGLDEYAELLKQVDLK